jgi:hypothetical protein
VGYYRYLVATNSGVILILALAARYWVVCG